MDVDFFLSQKSSQSLDENKSQITSHASHNYVSHAYDVGHAQEAFLSIKEDKIHSSQYLNVGQTLLPKQNQTQSQPQTQNPLPISSFTNFFKTQNPKSAQAQDPLTYFS